MLAEVFGDGLCGHNPRFADLATAARGIASAVRPLIMDLSTLAQADWAGVDLPHTLAPHIDAITAAHSAYAGGYSAFLRLGISLPPGLLSSLCDDPDPADPAATESTSIRCHGWDFFDFLVLPLCHGIEAEVMLRGCGVGKDEAVLGSLRASVAAALTLASKGVLEDVVRCVYSRPPVCIVRE